MPDAEEDTENAFYLAVGPFAAILIGAACVPLRGLTTASNFAFVFMALTILVAELGGRWAAVATALTSGLSLDFFLTQPYMRLTIAEKHDVIAVGGLTACGLIAAAFGTQRSKRTAALAATRKHLDLLHAALSAEAPGETVESRLTRILRASREALPLAAAVVRNDRGQVVAGADAADARRPLPDDVLDASAPGWIPLPENGVRIPLFAGDRRLGWLDVWGNGLSAPPPSRRTLSDLARCLALLLAAHVSAADALGQH
jgi:K+-sensing histidine kinase KdpD